MKEKIKIGNYDIHLGIYGDRFEIIELDRGTIKVKHHACRDNTTEKHNLSLICWPMNPAVYSEYQIGDIVTLAQVEDERLANQDMLNGMIIYSIEERSGVKKEQFDPRLHFHYMILKAFGNAQDEPYVLIEDRHPDDFQKKCKYLVLMHKPLMDDERSSSPFGSCVNDKLMVLINNELLYSNVTDTVQSIVSGTVYEEPLQFVTAKNLTKEEMIEKLEAGVKFRKGFEIPKNDLKNLFFDKYYREKKSSELKELVEKWGA